MANSGKSKNTVTKTVGYDVAEQLRTPEEVPVGFFAWNPSAHFCLLWAGAPGRLARQSP